MPKVNLRNFLLTGLVLCVLLLAVIAILNPDFRRLMVKEPKLLALITVVLVWNTYAAIRWTHPVAMEDSLALHLGVRWGLAVGGGWGLVAIVPLNVFTPKDEVGAPLWFLGLFSGIILPFASGAAGAIKTGSVQVGRRVGFWSGVIGGLLGFLIFVIRGFVAAGSLSLQGSETAGFALVAAFYSMYFFGSLYGGIAGTVGGWIGLRLYRTGEPPTESSSAADAVTHSGLL